MTQGNYESRVKHLESHNRELYWHITGVQVHFPTTAEDMEKQGGNSEIQKQRSNFKIHSQTYQTLPLSVYASL